MSNLGICPNDGSSLKDVGDGILHCPICPFNVPGNKKVLETLYAWVSVDPEGREGFMACQMPNGTMMALTHSEMGMILKLEDIARQSIASIPGYRARLIKFSNREVVKD